MENQESEYSRVKIAIKSLRIIITYRMSWINSPVDYLDKLAFFIATFSFLASLLNLKPQRPAKIARLTDGNTWMPSVKQINMSLVATRYLPTLQRPCNNDVYVNESLDFILPNKFMAESTPVTLHRPSIRLL